MRHRGDAEAGFAIEVDSAKKVLRIRAWGFWGDALAESLGPSLLENGRADASEAVVDAKDLKPQRESGQRAIAALFDALSKLKIPRATMVVTNALTRLQIMRIAKERTTKDVAITFTAE